MLSIDGDMVLARKFALQWSGPYLYVQTINSPGEITCQEDGRAVGRPFWVHLSKLGLYRDPEAYPGHQADLFKLDRWACWGMDPPQGENKMTRC